MKLPHWLKHDWSKWIPYQAHMYYNGMWGTTYGADAGWETWQKRHCLVCGITQDERV